MTLKIFKTARYECDVPPSDKFWEVSAFEDKIGCFFVQTRYGAKGTKGSFTTKKMSSKSAALSFLAARARQKEGKGYILVGSQMASSKSIAEKVAKFKSLFS